MKKAAFIGGAALLVLGGIVIFIGVLIVVLFGGLSSIMIQEEERHSEGGRYAVEISELGKNEIPAEFVPIYQKAADAYGIPWTLLASIHRIETVFSSIDPMISPVGAEGHFQFMPCTWAGWGNPTCGGVGSGAMTKSEMTDPANIREWGGYGVDANNDGKADPWDLEDAAHSAANYLASSGGADGDFESAIFAYNRAGWYVDEVLEFMDLYTESAELVEVGAGKGSGDPVDAGPDEIEAAIAAGKTIVGQSPYVWGGGRTQADVDARRFDCSSFIRWIFDEAGVDVGPLSGTTTETLNKLGKSISPNDMVRGDILFFDTYKIDGHVAIYLGGGEFLHDSSSEGVNIGSLSNPYWDDAFNGHVRRYIEG